MQRECLVGVLYTAAFYALCHWCIRMPMAVCEGSVAYTYRRGLSVVRFNLQGFPTASNREASNSFWASRFFYVAKVLYLILKKLFYHEKIYKKQIKTQALRKFYCLNTNHLLSAIFV